MRKQDQYGMSQQARLWPALTHVRHPSVPQPHLLIAKNLHIADILTMMCPYYTLIIICNLLLKSVILTLICTLSGVELKVVKEISSRFFGRLGLNVFIEKSLGKWAEPYINPQIYIGKLEELINM